MSSSTSGIFIVPNFTQLLSQFLQFYDNSELSYWHFSFKKMETNMKTCIGLIIVFCGLLLIGCDLSTDPTSNNGNIRKVIGLVSGDDIQVGYADLYCFGDYGDKAPASEGFKTGDNVYFEAEVVLSNKNAQGGTTYWCKLLSIKKYN
jgi:hypothetical protein